MKKETSSTKEVQGKSTLAIKIADALERKYESNPEPVPSVSKSSSKTHRSTKTLAVSERLLLEQQIEEAEKQHAEVIVRLEKLTRKHSLTKVLLMVVVIVMILVLLGLYGFFAIVLG